VRWAVPIGRGAYSGFRGDTWYSCIARAKGSEGAQSWGARQMQVRQRLFQNMTSVRSMTDWSLVRLRTRPRLDGTDGTGSSAAPCRPAGPGRTSARLEDRGPSQSLMRDRVKEGSTRVYVAACTGRREQAVVEDELFRWRLNSRVTKMKRARRVW